MVLQSLPPDAYQMGEEHQLGIPQEMYTRSITLSGKVAFTGILLLGFFLVIDAILLIGWEAAAAFMESPLGFAQGIFLVGSLLSMIRHEHMTTPFHPKLSVTLYTAGLLYRKGRTIQVVRWEEVQSIERQFKVYHRKGKITDVRPAYTCELFQKPNLVLSAEITGVAEVGTIIERELTKRLLSALQFDYRAGNPIAFSQLTLTQQSLKNRKKDMRWTWVSRIEVGPEELVVEGDGKKTDALTVSLSNVPNVCVLEALLEDISQEKGFEFCLSTTGKTRDVDTEKAPSEPGWRPQPRKTSWVSTIMLVLVVLPGLALQTWYIRESLDFQRVTDFPSQTFQVSGSPTLIINVDAVDSLYIVGQNINQVSVSGFKEITGFNHFDDMQEQTRQYGNTISLSWSMKTTTFFGIGSEKLDLYIDMPTRSELQITTRTGDLVIDSISGEMKVRTQSGHIEVAGTLLGHSQLQSTSGQVDYCGSPDPQSIDLFQSESGNINLNLSSNAAFSLSSASSMNRLTNDFGSNEVGAAPRARLEARTNTGMIAILNAGSTC